MASCKLRLFQPTQPETELGFIDTFDIAITLIRNSPLFSDTIFDSDISLPLTLPYNESFNANFNWRNDIQLHPYSHPSYPDLDFFNPPLPCELYSPSGLLLLRGMLTIEAFLHDSIECNLTAGLSAIPKADLATIATQLNILDSQYTIPAEQTLTREFTLGTPGTDIAIKVSYVNFSTTWNTDFPTTLANLIGLVNSSTGTTGGVVVSILSNTSTTAILLFTLSTFYITLTASGWTNFTTSGPPIATDVGIKAFYKSFDKFMGACTDWIANAIPGTPQFIFAPMANRIQTNAGITTCNINHFDPTTATLFKPGFITAFNTAYQTAKNWNVTPFVYISWFFNRLFAKYNYAAIIDLSASEQNIVFYNHFANPNWQWQYTASGFDNATSLFIDWYHNVINLNNLLPNQPLETVLNALQQLLNLAFITNSIANTITIASKNTYLLADADNVVDWSALIQPDSIRITRPFNNGYVITTQHDSTDDQKTESIQNFAIDNYFFHGYFQDFAGLSAINQDDIRQNSIVILYSDNYAYNAVYNTTSSLWEWQLSVHNNRGINLNPQQLTLNAVFDTPIVESVEVSGDHIKIPVVEQPLNGLQGIPDPIFGWAPARDKKDCNIRFMHYAGFQYSALSNQYPMLSVDNRDIDGNPITNGIRLLWDGPDGLYETYYKQWFNFIQCSREIQLEVNLSETDWIALDITRQVYFLSSYFLIVKIEMAFPVTKPAKVTLRKVEYKSTA